jgi:hypothetical protein
MKNPEGKKVTTKPWQLVEWKKKREEVLGDNCAQCGSSKKPLVLHHLRQTLPFSVIKALVAGDLFEAWISSNDIKLPIIPTNVCPKCYSCQVRVRKTIKPPWVCNRCHKGFEAPKEDLIIDQREESRLFIKFKEDNRELIHARCQAIQEKNYERYKSCEETATFCQKCAFLWDMKRMNLCPKCKVHYKQFRFPYCFSCSKELGLVHPTLMERLGVTKGEETKWGRELDQIHCKG